MKKPTKEPKRQRPPEESRLEGAEIYLRASAAFKRKDHRPGLPPGHLHRGGFPGHHPARRGQARNPPRHEPRKSSWTGLPESSPATTSSSWKPAPTASRSTAACSLSACAPWSWKAATSASTPRPTPTTTRWPPRASPWSTCKAKPPASGCPTRHLRTPRTAPRLQQGRPGLHRRHQLPQRLPQPIHHPHRQPDARISEQTENLGAAPTRLDVAAARTVRRLLSKPAVPRANAATVLLRLIGRQICAEPLMLRCMKLLGIGQINAFALLAIIGDVRRFRTARETRRLHRPQSRPARKRTRQTHQTRRRQARPRRHAQPARPRSARRPANGSQHPAGQMGLETLRPQAATATSPWRPSPANSLVQVWHLLSGNPPELLEPDKSFSHQAQETRRHARKGSPSRLIAALQRRCLCGASPNPCRRTVSMLHDLKSTMNLPLPAISQATSGKLSTRTRSSDELVPGPFSPRNLVDNFPQRPLPPLTSSNIDQFHSITVFSKEKT